MRMSRVVVPAVVLSITTLLIALFALAVLPTAPAQAHAKYVSSVPAANTTVKEAPTKVTITFAQKLDPSQLSITVYDTSGKLVSTGNATIVSEDQKTASVDMKSVEDSELYRVDWNTLSAEDQEATLGSFMFAVNSSGESDALEVPATPAPETNPTATILAGIIGLVVGAGAAYFVLRSRPAGQ